MNSLDVILVLILFAYAVSGYVQGFVVNLVATVGLLAGGLLAIAIVPRMLSGGQPTLSTSLLALAMVVAAAAIGQAVGTYVGTDLRSGLRWRPLRWLDAVGGAALSMVAVLAASWALGYSVSGTSIPYLSTASRGSTILAHVDDVIPSAGFGDACARSTRRLTPTCSRDTSTRSRTSASPPSTHPTTPPCSCRVYGRRRRASSRSSVSRRATAESRAPASRTRQAGS